MCDLDGRDEDWEDEAADVQLKFDLGALGR